MPGSQPQAPIPPRQVPYPQNVSPSIEDAVLVDEWEIRQLRQESRLNIDFGSPHPQAREWPGYRFVWQSPATPQQTVHRYWCRTRTGQDAYNWHKTYMAGNVSYPQFDRRYFLPREGYAPAAKLTPLTSLMGLVLTDGGGGYLGGGTGSLDLTFTGTGTGAAGRAEVQAGVIVAVALTNGGTGYTAAATVSATGGVGAVITSVIQPQTCVLTDEKAQPEEQQFASLFLRVDRRYETLPGPIVAKTGVDPQDGALTVDYTQRVALPATPATLSRGKGVDYGSGYRIIESEVVPDQEDGAVVGTSVWKTKLTPTPVTDIGTRNFLLSFPQIVETNIDMTTGIIVDEVKQVVPAGTTGSIVANNAKDIDTITVANPGKLTFKTPHFWTTGDTITISGVSGNTPSINTTKVITVVDAYSVTLNSTNITVAGTGGSAYRAGDPDAYIEVKALTEFESLSIRSAVRKSSVLGGALNSTAGWISYPVTIQWEQPNIFSGESLVTVGSPVKDAGLNYNDQGRKTGEFKGWADEGYFTQAQLNTFTSSYPAVTYKAGGGSKAVTVTNSADNTKVWTFHVPLSQSQVDGDPGPKGFKLMHIRGEQAKLGIFRITLIEGDVGI